MIRPDALVTVSIQGAILALAVWLACRVVPRMPARYRALLWMAVSLKLALGVLAPLRLPLPVLPAQASAIPGLGADGVSGVFAKADARPAPTKAAARAHPTAASAAEAAAPAFSAADLLLGLWAFGTTALLAGAVRHVLRLHRVVRRSEPLDRGPVAETARRLGVEIGLSHRPRLRVSADVSAPMVVGPMRPVVVLPAGFEASLSENEMEMAIAHELAHVRRGDLWLGAVPALAQALCWFNPVAWIAAREWATEREAACDAAALAATGGSPAVYGRLLMKIVADDHCGALPTALGATAAYHTLRRRLTQMKSFAARPTRGLRLSGAVLVGLALFAVLPWEVTAQTAPVESKNLVTNPGFERGLEGWRDAVAPPNMDAGIEMEIDRKVAHGGSASVRFRKSRVSFNPIRYLAQAVTRDSEQRRIEVGVWVKAENARKACVAIGFEADGTGTVAWGAYVGEAKEGDKPANHGWRRYTSVLAIPPGTESLNVMLQMYGPGTVWLDDVTVRYVPASTPLREAASEEDAGEDVKDVPNLDLRAGNDPMKRYFLIGKPVEGANKLLVVLPGGDGSAENNLFVRRVWKNALPPGYLIAELVAPKWSDGQMDSITWPTRKVRWTGMKFATEDFVEAVVKDVSAKAKIDPAKVFTLSWSSGGPAAYATSLANGPVKGSLIAMSVYYPQQLPPTINAGGHAYYLLHSPDDFIPMKLPEQAKKELTAAGAKVTLATYRGGHGWTEDPFGNIRKGVEWLEANVR